MNKHRKKCDHLKEIRKNMADALGVELNQTVCTYEGDCKGTCPKCQQEEKVLSKTLLAGTAVVASAAILLTGCSNEYDEIAGAQDDGTDYYDSMIDGGMSGPEYYEEETLAGDVVYIPENEE